MNTQILKSWIDARMNCLPGKAGANFGLPASWYLELDERPILRVAADGLVREVECDLAEEEQIVHDTDPVDFARRPDGKSTVFIWYRNEGGYKEVFRKHRQMEQQRTSAQAE
jgi:hypothetical protein